MFPSLIGSVKSFEGSFVNEGNDSFPSLIGSVKSRRVVEGPSHREMFPSLIGSVKSQLNRTAEKGNVYGFHPS